MFTIHDLMQIQLPEVATPAKQLYYRMVVKPAAWRAHRVLTVSEYSRVEILRWSGLPEDRVVNVGNGVGPPFQPGGQQWEPGFPYVLYVGNARPHKNLGRLLLAFRELQDPDLRLVIVGRRTAELTAAIEEAGLYFRVRFSSAVSDYELAAIYRGARLLVLPSLIEGFGLPVLEAMACGTPVAVSKNGALREVSGEASDLFDPLDVADMRRSIDRVLSDSALRATMASLGIERARQFSWDDVAGKVRAVLDSAAC